MGRQCYLYLLLLTTYIFFSQVRNVSYLLYRAELRQVTKTIQTIQATLLRKEKEEIL